MKVFDTSKDNAWALGGTLAGAVYNGLDSALTAEILEVILPQLEPNSQLIYDFERACQAPALAMMLRGIRVDPAARQLAIDQYAKAITRCQWMLDRLAAAIWNEGLNPNSPPQLKAFFYDHLGIPPQYIFEKGERRITTNADALEYIKDHYFVAVPFVTLISALRDFKKTRSVLISGVDLDGRMRTSYNVGGTNSGRWSSSKNAFGGGTNFQNLREDLKQIFIADEGCKLAYIDLETAESRIVAARGWQVTRKKGVGRDGYWKACDAGDLHTYVAKVVWPHFAWTGDKASDRKIADRLFYRHHSYRQACKVGGHGSNYCGKPPTMAKHTKIPEPLMRSFQESYFKSFPEIPAWHFHVIQTLMTDASITTLLGRKRVFFGRLDDESTWREGTAYEPQSVVGDILNLGAWRIWYYLFPRMELLAQVHDAVLVQYREEDETEVLPKAQRLMEIPIAVDERLVIIPTEALTGWNWNKGSPANPDGLMKWTGPDGRTRTYNQSQSLLDRPVHQVLQGLTHARDIQRVGGASGSLSRG